MLGAVVFVLLMAGLFVPLEAWFPVKDHSASRRAMLTALGLFALNLLLMNLLGGTLLDFLEDTFAAEAPDPSAVKIAGVFVLADFAGYWAHRLMHRVPLLWRLHSVHHAPKHLTWFEAWRQHPIDFVLHGIAVGAPGALLGASLSDVASVVLLRKAFTTFLHSNIHWRFGIFEWVLATPAFHHLHHSADPRDHDRNFAGTFPLTDLLFGTHRAPAFPAAVGLSVEVPGEVDERHGEGNRLPPVVF